MFYSNQKLLGDHYYYLQSNQSRLTASVESNDL